MTKLRVGGTVVESQLPGHDFALEFNAAEFEEIQASPTTATATTTDWLALAKTYKERGNLLFRTKDDLGLAATAEYKRALHCLRRVPRAQVEVYSLRVQLYVNLSACALAGGDYSACRRRATKAITLDAGNVKALYRRSVARRYAGFDLPGAESDLVAALAASTSDKEREMLARNLAELRRDRERSLAAEAEAAKRMFQ